jgi:mycoredoxin
MAIMRNVDGLQGYRRLLHNNPCSMGQHRERVGYEFMKGEIMLNIKKGLLVTIVIMCAFGMGCSAGIISSNNQTMNANSNVEIFTTSWCPYCNQAKAYLKSRGIPFTEYDVEQTKEAMSRKNEISSSEGVPVSIINGQVINGFSETAYDTALRGKPE